jgi:uncharacterized protein YndB with AHSA1/START domain
VRKEDLIVTRLHHTVDIDAPRDRVWAVLWDDKTYRDWTSAFMDGSHAVGDWKEGSKIRLLDSNDNGILAIIEEKVPNERMILRHIGEILEGKEQPAPSSWANAREEYTLKENGRGTTLAVETDAGEEHKEAYEKAFPKALQRLKELAARQPSGPSR